MKTSRTAGRRDFIGRAAKSAAVLGLAGVPGEAAAGEGKAKSGGPGALLMKAGHQLDHSETTLRALAAFGVTNICSGKIGKAGEEGWTVDGLTRLRKHVESFGIKLDCVPLPLSSGYITRSEHPEIMLAKDPERDRTLDAFCDMIRNCGKAGI